MPKSNQEHIDQVGRVGLYLLEQGGINPRTVKTHSLELITDASMREAVALCVWGKYNALMLTGNVEIPEWFNGVEVILQDYLATRFKK